MSFLNPRFGYSKIDKEDPDEANHRRAQFLIYKAMQQADSVSGLRKPSWFKLRGTRLRIRIGRKLIVRLRKTILSFVSGTEFGFHKQIVSQFKAFKRLARSSRGNGVSLQPVFRC